MNPQVAAGPESAALHLEGVVEALCRAGQPFDDFGVGDPQEPTPSFIVAALRAAIPAVSRYPKVGGSPAFREAVCGYLQRRFGVAVDPQTEVLPAAGAKEAIFHLPLALIDPASDRRTVLYPDPGYPIYERGAAFAGGSPQPLPLSPATGLCDLDALSATLLSRTALFWLCSPHNPTGAVAPRDYLRRLADLAERYGFVVAADECYADLWFEAPPASLLEVARRRVLVIHSCSKRSGMTGMRSGFIAGDSDLISALKRFRPAVGAASPDFVTAAATAAWNDDAHAAERRLVFAEKRAIFEELLRRRQLAFTGEAGLYLWIAVPPTRPQGVGDDLAFAHDLAARAGIVLQPGSFLGEGGRGFVRLALAPTVERCRAAAARWSRIA